MDRINKLQEWLRESPDDSFLQHALALEFIKVGDDKKAQVLFEKIIEGHPDYIGSYYHLAKLLERIGDVERANQVYLKGMNEAEKAGEKFAYGELKSAWEELTF